MRHKPRTRYQRMQLASELAGIIQRNTSNESVQELASAIRFVLAAPSEIRSGARLACIEQLIHENSGNCCFKQRGYNWHFGEGLWTVAARTICNKIQTWPAALDAAMRDPEFRALKPS